MILILGIVALLWVIVWYETTHELPPPKDEWWDTWMERTMTQLCNSSEREER